MLKLLNLSKTRVNLACRCISTTSVRQQQSQLKKSDEGDHGIRVIEKKPARQPLVKNFFLGQIDTDLIAYPEAIYENEHINSVNQQKKSYEDFLEANIFQSPDDVNNIAKLKDFGSFRSTSTLSTEVSYGSNEAEGKILSYGTFLNSHHQVLKVLNQFGSASQKLKYLSKLESGELIGAPAMFESKFSEAKKPFITAAKFNDNENKWTLNGEKSFVVIPTQKDSSLFLVIAMAETVDHVGDFKDGFSVFFVEGSLPGVNIIGVDETIGCNEKAFKQVTLSFKDVILDESSKLSQDGLNVVISFLRMSRLDKGVQAMAGVMRPMLTELANNSINTKVQGIHMKDVETIKEQIGSLTCSLYALESMVYMTAGLIDIYEKQDVDIETAMVQAFAIQAMTDFMVRPLHTVGSQAVVKGSAFERFIRDATQLAATGEPLDGVKQFIALSGLNHTGYKLNDTIKKDRNPLHHPGFIFSRLFNQTSIENTRRKFNLEQFVHPSLDPASKCLEESILRLGAVSEILLGRHGPLVIEHTAEVAKLAEAATLCYAMFASAARASRSYCIGLRNADQEMNLANFICFDYAAKVKKIAVDLDNGEYGSGEHTFKTIGEKVIESKGYHLEHPTTRNF